MLILKLALRNLKRHTKKTLLLAALITIGMAFVFFANSLFESTNQGLKKSFIGSLSGDLVIAAESETNFSLFGNEMPIIGEYENIPPISGYSDIKNNISSVKSLESWSPIVSGAGYLEIEGFKNAVPVFGIDPESYFNVCSDIEILDGNTEEFGNNGIFINKALLDKIEKRLERSLKIGEPVTLSMYSDGSFRIRTALFAGVHKYAGKTKTLERVVLADPVIVRSLANYTLGYTSEKDVQTSDSEDDFSMDDLFSEDTEDFSESETNDSFSLESLEETLSEDSPEQLYLTDSASWSFILLKAKEGQDKVLQKTISEEVERSYPETKTMSWRDAAGLSAQAVFALQSAFNGGIFFIIIGAVLVIMNALVISVLERTYEIGTMRAVGADKSFIRSLFIAESMILVMCSSAAGIILGIIMSFAVSFNGIPLNNEILINMFGGSYIKPSVSFYGIAVHLAAAAVIASVAWIYPVSVAVKIQPASVMGKG